MFDRLELGHGGVTCRTDTFAKQHELQNEVQSSQIEPEPPELLATYVTHKLQIKKYL